MLRIVEHGARVAAFHRLAALHDQDAVADVIGGRKIVRDIDDRDLQLVAQRLEQVDDRHPQRRIHHRHRLVGDDQRGRRDQRARDRDPLQLPARQLVREAAFDFGERQPDLMQRLVGLGLDLDAPARARETPGADEEIAVDPLERIEGLERILEDRLHLPHEGHALAIRADARHVGAEEADRAVGRHRQIEDHAGERGLAGARFADDGEDFRLAGFEPQAHVVDRPDCAAAQEPADHIGHADMIDVEERTLIATTHAAHRAAPSPSRRRDGPARHRPSADARRGRSPSRAGSADGSGSREADWRDWAARPRGRACCVTSPIRGRLATRCDV